MEENNFIKIVESIRNNKNFEEPSNWDARGLTPSDKPTIKILRNATNDFLNKLEKVNSTSEPSKDKLDKVSTLVEELPWDELDTEEKEFMADVLAPSIQAIGFDPWSIF